MVENFATDYKEKITQNEFTSIAAAYRDAQKIYSEHCPNYQSSKAVVTSVNGRKQVKKKAEPAPDIQAIAQPEPANAIEPEPTIRKQDMVQAVRELFRFY